MIQNKNLQTLLEKISSSTNVKNYLFIHYGNLDQDIAISSIQLIEKKLKLENFDRNIITKTKTVCIEILQNIIKHQKQYENVFPYFIIGSDGTLLTIYAGNVISLESKEVISRSITDFKNIDKSNLKEKYLEALRDSSLTDKGNAGMGLLDIMYRSNKHFNYEINDLSNNLFMYNITVLLNDQEGILA